MAIEMPVWLSDLLACAKMAPGLLKEFPSQTLCHLTNASFVLCAKSTLRTAQILYLDSLLWTLFGMSSQAMSSLIRTNHLTSDDMNSWIGLRLGHTLPKAADWAHWLSSEQPYFHVPVTQLQVQPKMFSSQVLLNKTLKTLSFFKPVENSSRILETSSNFNN